MYAFLSNLRPRSVQASSNTRYKEGLRKCAEADCGHVEPSRADLYGIVYYFHNRPHQLDADNLSKPVLDSLTGYLYDDDRRIKLRYSGVHDLSGPGIDVLDISRIP